MINSIFYYNLLLNDHRVMNLYYYWMVLREDIFVKTMRICEYIVILYYPDIEIT